MNIREWDERYRAMEDQSPEPTPLVVEFEALLQSTGAPGRALDLACGTGRDSIYLASRGWQVTAVDGAASALEILNRRNSAIRTVVAELDRHEFVIEPQAWDLILSCYYLQRDLFPAMQAGVRPGGVVIAIVHTPDPGQEPSYKRAAPGELRSFFKGWEILHDYEGRSRDPAHKRPVAEIVARK